MKSFFLNDIRTCPEIGQPINTRQNEESCRSQHGCEQASCPMAREFRLESVDFQLAEQRLVARSRY